MKFLLDHDVPDRIAGLLAHAGHDVVKLREVLDRQTDDAAVLDFARQSEAILVTCNRDDFLRLVSGSRASFPGIVILIRRRSRIAECAALLRLLDRAGPSGLKGNINFA